MKNMNRRLYSRGVGMLLGGALMATLAHAEAVPDPNAFPTPYHEDIGWAQLAIGRPLGATTGIGVDRDGKSIWVFDRCGGSTCEKSKIAPIMKFDAHGHLLMAFGSGLINDPHGFFVDRNDNIWVTDFKGADGKGQTVSEFSPDGKLLKTLGKPGVAGTGPDTFNAPSGVVVAPNGDIFVADGHGGDTNARVVKLSREGEFIAAFGKKGTAPGEFDVPHGIAMDSTGRLFVADRGNGRIQIFDQTGKFLAEWKQFGRPSCVFITADDTIYVTDSESSDKNNPGFKQGIRIGSAKDGTIKAFIPATAEEGAPESVAADSAGNVYAGYTATMTMRRFIITKH